MPVPFIGVILIKREQYTAAIKQLTAAIDRAHLLGSYVNRGYCYERLGHKAEAVSDYGTALRLTATSALEQEAQELARIRLASLSKDGSTVSTDTVRLHSLQIGSKIVTNVIASASAPGTDLLLGGSFLSKLRHWSPRHNCQVRPACLPALL